MKKILVANRGEIAMRVLRSCKDAGIKTVAVFSEADRNAPFVKFADEAVCIGPPASSESYLKMDTLIEVSKNLDVDGIHPGYGFLSENAEFAKLVTNAGITFIGPMPDAINTMGNKLAAKEAVSKYDIPLVPGTDKAIVDVSEALEVAKGIGFPILIKASAGGGGKGMRTVEREEDLEEQLTMAMNEAKSAFGDGSVFIERYITDPRHIEFQVLADSHGNVVHLFERECSIQRRHQKVVEEAPSAVLTPELREVMGKCACDVARSCDYLGAGTVEFILENNTNFYFLEMNTRLQVEHPVTEMITGVDLVKEQIKIARGEAISFSQEDLRITGHSIEVRVYAEDPMNNFLPDIGTLEKYVQPTGEGVRVDDGFEEGMEIPIYYDPMISKLITYGSTRNEAIARMTDAIDGYKIEGVKTTMPFCKYAINHDAFVSGNFDTHFVQKYFSPEILDGHDSEEEKMAAILVGKILDEYKGENTYANNGEAISKWKLNRL
ncbi:MAG: acetyl-CoA carboxylase biotin carboxylase subunit [Crocinitomicaceae bacterium]|nr:acetyl-CoA carboxylase biotin carboxylase subunit [Crocinitomicaceae bacterium]|tara:strand:- start:10017 stop:11495 length:1479 start_codon:yes stop_codon:yes gene_type:complete